MGQGAYIFGCEGLKLSQNEASFFKESDPWGFILFARNVDHPDQLKALCGELRECLGRNVPILIDQEGGRVQRLRAPYWREFLPPLDQAAIAKDPQRAMWLRGRLLAEDLQSVGIDVNCAPSLDVAQNDTHRFLKNRCYGFDAGTVVSLARELEQGLAAGGVAAVMKHIPGHGRSLLDTHLKLPRVSASLDDLREDFEPFVAFNHLSMAMTAHIIFEAIDPDHCATQSPLVSQFIRNQIGFNGLLMSDDLSMEALDGSIFERAQMSIHAGCDIALHCNGKLNEMEEVAQIGSLSPAAQKRADHAFNARPYRQEGDIQAFEAELKSLLTSS